MSDYKTKSKILINTHKLENINLLKVRDYFFDKARKLNTLKLIVMLLPLLFSVLIIFPLFASIVFLDSYGDMILSLFAILCFILQEIVENKIEDNLYISNAFREEYDNKVFEIEKNKFIYNKINLEDYIKFANFMPNRDKYEAWYSEIFCDNENFNIICAQMDNVIYTRHVYEATKKLWDSIITSVIVVSACFLPYFLLKGAISGVIVFFIAVFNIFQVLYEERTNMTELIEVNKNIIDDVKNIELQNLDSKLYIRCLQDVIVTNRNNSLFIPKKIRNEFLKNGNPYYQELDEIKYKLMEKQNPSFIHNASDIPILPLTQKVEPEQTFSTLQEPISLVNMNDIHEHLLKILTDVKQVWEEAGINYTLDGGTLLGAIRENGKFLFWDDDVDLMIPISELAKAKEIIKNTLGNKYEIQDCITDRFYSPRLSNFRIREKNEISCVSEKDSPLWTEYKYKGLFLDIYAYSPIFINTKVDFVYKKLFFYKLNKKLKKTENTMIYSESTKRKTKAEKNFQKFKHIYMKRLTKYIKLAKNKNYASYTPNYIADYKKDGPYFIGTDITAERKTAKFENDTYYIPNNPEGILESCYGKNWNISPYIEQEILQKGNEKNWYSRNTFNVSVLKHLTFVDLYK